MNEASRENFRRYYAVTSDASLLCSKRISDRFLSDCEGAPLDMIEDAYVARELEEIELARRGLSK